MKNRAGEYINQPTGYRSFKPCKLPPSPDIKFDPEMIELLSSADRALGKLDGITQTLPDPDLFVAMYVQKEAVLSSQIEGTQASLSDILSLNSSPEKREDIDEIVNYVQAIKYGISRLESLPLSLRLIKEIHSVLLKGVRGHDKDPGEFRKSQNWIGPAGCNIQSATFVPPCVPDMIEAMGELELYMHENDSFPPLIKIALIHAQFETIHPFLDGNGRMGRLLITFWLYQQNILSQPLLYLSYYFKQNRIEYYDRLMIVRNSGDWEQWIKYFLRGISIVSEEAANTAFEILQLKKECEALLSIKNNVQYLELLNYLFRYPAVSKKEVADNLHITLPTATKMIEFFCDNNILVDRDPNKQRNKVFLFSRYIQILNRGTDY